MLARIVKHLARLSIVCKFLLLNWFTYYGPLCEVLGEFWNDSIGPSHFCDGQR